MLLVIGVVGQIAQHGRAVGAGPQKFGKRAHGMGADDFAVVYRLQVVLKVGEDVDIEVVGPEDDHTLVQLPRAVEHTIESGRQKLKDMF